MLPFLGQFDDEEIPAPEEPTYYAFSPPLGGRLPHWRKETPDHERRFFAHFWPGTFAVNVHLLIDGTFTEDEGLAPEMIEKTYRGATLNPITAAEAIALITAGYSVPAYEEV